MWITTNWKILKEMGIPDHLICLLQNLYASQEATVRTRQRNQKHILFFLINSMVNPLVLN